MILRFAEGVAVENGESAAGVAQGNLERIVVRIADGGLARIAAEFVFLVPRLDAIPTQVVVEREAARDAPAVLAVRADVFIAAVEGLELALVVLTGSPRQEVRKVRSRFAFTSLLQLRPAQWRAYGIPSVTFESARVWFQNGNVEAFAAKRLILLQFSARGVDFGLGHAARP